MARNEDLKIRILGSFDGQPAFKSAEASAKAMARELDKLEQQERALANAQIAAAREASQRAQDAHDAAMSLSESVGKVAVAGGAALAAGLGLATKAAMDWESAWVGVEKTVDGNAEQMAQLQDQLRGLARTLPSTHDEIAAVAEAAGQLGVKRQDIAAFTKTMIDLGQSTNLSAEDAATQLAQLMNIMGTAPQDVDRLGASLVALGNDGASTEADILAMGLRIAGAGKTIGLTEAQVLSIGNALASVGIDAEAGGSAISRVMIDIAQSVEEGGGKLDSFAKVAGMSSAQFQAAFRDDAAGALSAFITGLGRMQTTGQSTFKTLDDLGLSQIRVRDTLLRAANAGDLLTASLATGNQAWDENTALVQEASKRYATAESRIAIARNQLNDAAIDIGANVLPAISAVAERGGTLGEVFHELPGPVKQGVTILGAFAATASIAGGAALLLIPKIGALRTTLEAMGTRGARGLRALNSTTSLLSGPWGIALAAGAIALGAFANSQLKAKHHVDELRDSLDKESGALTANSRESIFKALQDNGALDIAKRLGVSLADVTNAALGEADAQYRLGEARAAAAAASAQPNTPELLEWQQLTDKIGDQSGALNKARDEWKDRQAAMAGASETESSTAGAVSGTTKALGEQQQTAEEAEQAIKDLKDALDSLNGVHLNARAAARDFEQAVDDATASIKKNGKSLDITTQKGRDNQDALDGIASKANDLAKAILDETGSEAMMHQSLAESRAQLIKTAEKFGMSKSEAKKYADQVLKIPEDVGTKVGLDGIPRALTQIEQLEQALRGIKGRSVDVVVNRKIAVGNVPMADGGVLTFADGAHVAQIAPAGAWRVWAEPETGGEAYIPLAQSKRGRSKEILDDVAEQFGARVVYFASGSTVRRKAKPNPLAGLRSQYGRYLDTDIVGALIGAPDAVVSDAVQRINTAFDKVSTITDKLAKSHKTTAARLERDAASAERAMSKLADTRDAVVDRLKDATDKLATLQGQYDDYAGQVASRAGAQGALDQLFFGKNYNGDDITRSWQDVVALMQQTTADTKSFTDQIDQLRAAGLNQSLIEQIVGSDDGASIAKAILDGGADAVTQLNTTAGELTTASQALGKEAADSLYGAGVQAAKGLVDGLASQQKAIEAQMVKIAAGIQKAIRRALDMHSPSRVLHGVGALAGESVALGLASSVPSVETQASRLAFAAIPSSRTVQAVHSVARTTGPTAIYVQNPFTGEYLLARMQREAGTVTDERLAGLVAQVGMR